MVTHSWISPEYTSSTTASYHRPEGITIQKLVRRTAVGLPSSASSSTQAEGYSRDHRTTQPTPCHLASAVPRPGARALNATPTSHWPFTSASVVNRVGRSRLAATLHPRHPILILNRCATQTHVWHNGYHVSASWRRGCWDAESTLEHEYNERTLQMIQTTR